MDYATHLEKIKYTQTNEKLKRELDFLQKNENTNMIQNFNNFNIDNRITHIELILNIPVIEKETVAQKRELIFKEMDKYTYKKQWNKLLPFHKIVKLKEYLNKNIQDEELRNKLIIELSKYAEEGKLNTKKLVTYDPNSESILSISCLHVDNDKKTYTIKIVQ